MPSRKSWQVPKRPIAVTGAPRPSRYFGRKRFQRFSPSASRKTAPETATMLPSRRPSFVKTAESASSQAAHLRLRLLRPESDVHLAVHRQRSRQVFRRLQPVAGATIELAEAEVAMRSERTHAELLRQREAARVVCCGSGGVDRITESRDLGEYSESNGLVGSFLVLLRQLDRASSAPQSLVGAAGPQIRFGQAAHANGKTQTHRADRRFAVDRLFEEGKRLGKAARECVRVAEARQKIRSIADTACSKQGHPALEHALRIHQIPPFEAHACERAVCLDHGVWMLRSLGDLHRLFCMLERLAEPSEMREQEPKPRVRPGLEEGGQRPWVRERLDGLQEARRRLLEVANRKVRLSQPVLRFDLEPRISQFAGDVESLSARLEGAPMVAHVAEPRAHVGEDEPQPPSIAELAREDFGLPHVIQDAVVLAQRSEDDPRVVPVVDGLSLGLASLGHVREGAKRLLEGGQGLAVRRAHRGAQTSLAEVRDGPLPHFASQGVVGEPLDVLGEPIGIEPLDHLDDARVQLTTSLLQKGAVSHVVRERVLEGVFEVGKEARLVEELGGLEAGQTTPEVGFILLGDRLKQRERHVMADDGGRLEQTLLLDGQPVDARGQNRVDAGRDLDGLDGLDEAIRAGLADERLRLHKGSDALLEEERVPFRPFDQYVFELVERGIGAEQNMEKLLRTSRRQRLHASLGVVRLVAPPMLVLRAVVDEEQKTSTRQPLHEAIQHGLALGVDPVEILDHDHERLHAALSEQEMPHAVERLLPAFRGVQSLPRLVFEWHLEQSQERRERRFQRPVQ